MENQNPMNDSFIQNAKELIKPSKVADIYAGSSEVEALCQEFGSGTDCRISNTSIDPNADSLLF